MKSLIIFTLCFTLSIVKAQTFTKATNSQPVSSSLDTRNVMVMDLDNNSYPDIYAVNRPQDQHELYLSFRDTILEVPAGHRFSSFTQLSGGLASGDLDGDCLPDIYMANGAGGNGAVSSSNSLFQNTGNDFLPISNSGATSFYAQSSSANMIDFDADGDLDIFVCNDNSNYDELYRNDGNNVFFKLDTIGINDSYQLSRNAAWCDYDNDGDLDVFIPTSGNNLLFRNDDSVFTKITTGSIVNDGGMSASASWGDYDGDGHMDLYVGNLGNTTPSPQNFLYHNQGNGTFQKVTSGIQVTKRGKTISTIWLDFDNDGDLDLLAIGAHSQADFRRENDLYRNDGNGNFSEITSGSLVNNLTNNTGAATADFDKDGDIDVFLGTRGDQNELYLNDLNGASNFISLNLLGTGGKANAFNAKVKIKSSFNGNNKWEFRRVLPTNGNGQSSSILHFGLGSATIVDSVVIEWLGGQTCVFTNVAGNKFYNVDPAGCRMDTILETVFEDSINYFQAQFTDFSGGDITAWHWDFGDGDTSTIQNPVHNYASAGRYKVCLVTYDSYCKWDSVCTYVDICPDTATIGFQTHAAGKTISFFDTSSANAYQYNWTFGDGSSGSGKTPTHRYSNDGTYYVCLAMTDSCRTKVYCDSIQVCNDTLVANFGTNVSVMNVSFIDSSSNADSVFWNFGDGNTSTALNPSHTYTTPGYYVVCQTVVDYCNSISYCDTIGVCVDTAKAAFGFSNNGLLFNFINTSANATSYAWDFGDGNFSTQQNPTHVYAAHGIYSVCLIITNDCYSDTICENVAVCNLNPVAAYSYQGTATPMVIQFNDQSQDAQSYMWDFGDGSSSTNQNPLKAYASKAIYKVCLSITDSCGKTDSTCSNLNLINFSTEESEWLGELKIYPNPTKGEVSIESEALVGTRLTLQVNDITGRQLMEKVVNTTNGIITLDLTQHPKGLYILNLTDGNNMKSIRLSRN